MAIFTVHAGDFKQGLKHEFLRGKLHMRVQGKFFRETICSSQVAKIESATEESVVRLSGAAGWGITGGLILGPVGLLAGLLLGGRSQDITFICIFKDGRKFLGTAPSKVFAALQKKALAISF